MEQLTAFERALLGQFEALASACEASLKESAATASALGALSETAGKRIAAIERQQTALSGRLDELATALRQHTLQTTALVDAVNRLLSAQQR
jgi:transcription elongation GreA/GreB family factor